MIDPAGTTASGDGTIPPRRRLDFSQPIPANYKWVALFVSTLGMLMATIDGSITLIALPDIFRGIGIDPLVSGNSFYLLWMILGFLVVTSVLVVSFGRLGDIYGRVRIYNLGFAVFTFFSLALSVTWLSGHPGGHLAHRDADLPGGGCGHVDGQLRRHLDRCLSGREAGHGDGHQPGRGIQRLVHRSGAWRCARSDQLATDLPGLGPGRPARHRDGLSLVARAEPTASSAHRLAGQHHVRPGPDPDHGRHHLWDRALWRARHGMDEPGRTDVSVRRALSCWLSSACIETRVDQPMFRLQLFKIRAFSAGLFASLLAALSRGGLMFMLIIWLQGIWLPLHGYSFERTPLWAGIAILPLTAGLLIAGPVSGILSDRFGARLFASGGMIGTAVCFLILEFVPVNFPYPLFAVLLFFMGLSMASFGSPNRAAVMSSIPAEYRGVGSGMNTTFQNSAQVLSIGIFFSLIILGPLRFTAAESLPRAGGARRAEWGGPPGVPTPACLDALCCAARIQPGPTSRWTARLVAVIPGAADGSDRSELLSFPHRRTV